MTKNIQLHSESLMPTSTSDSAIRASVDTPIAETSTKGPACKIYNFDGYSESPPSPPKNHSSISNFLSDWESDPVRKSHLEAGRKWVAESFYSDDGVTVRSLRLNKGWSQKQLADELLTSQPHIARIEKGTENVGISTCRKLAQALGVDLNTLNEALLRQESIAVSNQK